MKKTIKPNEIPTAQLHQLLVGSVAPRPIALVSTINETGQSNLAPYSFFNVFSSNPPIMIFSSNRKVASNETKDTLHNIEATGEVVVNIVSHDIVRQMAISSVAFPADVDEFKKSGLTPMPSELVRPFSVKESPVSFECKVTKIMKLGDQGGAGNLMLCEVVNIHISAHIFDEEGRIDPNLLDVVGRMGRAFYSRAKDGIFKVFQPVPKLVIGYDKLPEIARKSDILSGNDLGILAGLFELPTAEAIQKAGKTATLLSNIIISEKIAKKLIKEGKAAEALALLMYVDQS